MDERLEKLLSVMAKSQMEIGGANQPGMLSWIYPRTHPIEGVFYFGAPFLETLYDVINRLEKKGFNSKDIAELFGYPSRIADITWMLSARRNSKLSKEQGIALALRLVDCLQYLRTDVFCESGENYIWDRKILDETLKKRQFISIDNRSLSLVEKLGLFLYFLTDLSYFVYPGFGREMHGPYQANGKKLIVRDYHGLRPEFLPFIRELPFSRIVTFEMYYDVDIKFNFFNRMWSSKGLLQNLKRFSLEVDGERIHEISEIEKMASTLERIFEKGVAYFESIPRKDFFKKFSEAVFYSIMLLRQELNEDWEPPQTVYDKIDAVDPPPQLVELMRKVDQLPMEEKAAATKRVFDPRID